MSWGGQHLKAVDIGAHGAFRFVLVRVSDRTSAHRLLVRGHNGTSIDELVRDVTSEASNPYTLGQFV